MQELFALVESQAFGEEVYVVFQGIKETIVLLLSEEQLAQSEIENVSDFVTLTVLLVKIVFINVFFSVLSLAIDLHTA